MLFIQFGHGVRGAKLRDGKDLDNKMERTKIVLCPMAADHIKALTFPSLFTVGAYWLFLFINWLTATLATRPSHLSFSIHPWKNWMAVFVGAFWGTTPLIGWTAVTGRLDRKRFTFLCSLHLATTTFLAISSIMLTTLGRPSSIPTLLVMVRPPCPHPALPLFLWRYLCPRPF